MSSGQRFMTDLLVSSLMADGGLETSLNLAVKAEIKELEEKKVGWLTCVCVCVCVVCVCTSEKESKPVATNCTFSALTSALLP